MEKHNPDKEMTVLEEMEATVIELDKRIDEYMRNYPQFDQRPRLVARALVALRYERAHWLCNIAAYKFDHNL